MTDRDAGDSGEATTSAEKRSKIETTVLTFTADPIIRWQFSDPDTGRNDVPVFGHA